MSVLVFLTIFLSLIGCSRAAMYCVCNSGVPDTALQKTIDYACGNGADCRPILQNGACFQPNTVKSHCDYAANSYFQNKGQTTGSCDFSGTATTTSSLPSVTAGCTYPTSPGQAYTGTGTPGSTVGGNIPGSPATGGIYGSTGGMGPAGMDSTNPSGSPSLLQQHWTNFFSLTLTMIISGLIVLWG